MNNGLCCALQNDFHKKTNPQFINHQEKPLYTLNRSHFFKSSNKSLALNKPHEEVLFTLSSLYENENQIFNWIEEHCYVIKKSNDAFTFREVELVVLHLQNKNQRNSMTLLLSHDHIATLGRIYPFLIDLCTQLKCDIICYDYSGYGQSTGKASDEATISDIDAVANFCFKTLNITKEKLILFGIGLGALPTLSFANEPNNYDIKGVILLSQLLSSNKEYKTNPFTDINCPVFLIHGQLNKVITHLQTKAFGKGFKTVYEWYPSKGSYSNITSSYRYKLFPKLKNFFSFIQSIRPIQPHSHYLSDPKAILSYKPQRIKVEENIVTELGTKDLNQMNKPTSSSFTSSSNIGECNYSARMSSCRVTTKSEFNGYVNNINDQEARHIKENDAILQTIRAHNVNFNNDVIHP